MKSLITCLALAGVLLIGTSVYAFGPNGLVGSMGSGVMGSGVTGSGVTGSGVNGSGIWNWVRKWFGYPNRNSGDTGNADDGKLQGKRYQGTDSYRTNSNNSCK